MTGTHQDSPKIYAVLTGDLIGSSGFDARQRAAAPAIIAATTAAFSRHCPGALAGAADFFRGDAWQIALAEPERALRLALSIRAGLRAGCDVDARLAIGFGRVDALVADKISRSHGEAFVASGHALDGLKSRVAMTAALPARAGALARWLPLTMHFCDALVQDWTLRQAELVGDLLARPGATQAAIARSRDVAQQTVQRTLAAAGWRLIEETLERFEATDWRRLLASGGDHDP